MRLTKATLKTGTRNVYQLLTEMDGLLVSKTELQEIYVL